MRIDIMVDIETLGTDTDSTIIQIAAIAFDIKTGGIYKEFNQIIDIGKNKNPIKVSAGTIKWWMNTNPELFNELLQGGNESGEQALRLFYFWISKFVGDGNDVYLWGNGILFDNKIIQYQLESLGWAYPIHYRNDRDLRTLVELTCMKLGITEKELKSRFTNDNYTAHNALDDVRYQIDIAVGCMAILVNEEATNL